MCPRVLGSWVEILGRGCVVVNTAGMVNQCYIIGALGFMTICLFFYSPSRAIKILLVTPYSVAQLCPTLCNPMDCSPPGSSVSGIFQARILQLPFPAPGDLPDPGTEPCHLYWQADSLPLNYLGSPISYAAAALASMCLFMSPRSLTLDRAFLGTMDPYLQLLPGPIHLCILQSSYN